MHHQPEDALARAARHVAEGEARVARQAAIVAEMERDNHLQAAAQARQVLATPQETLTLELWREHLRLERAARGLEP